MAALLQTSPRPEVKYLDPKSLMPSITPTCLLVRRYRKFGSSRFFRGLGAVVVVVVVVFFFRGGFP